MDTAAKLGFMAAVGADEVIDHLREDFTRHFATYDRVLDLVARRSASDCRRALAPGGVYQCVGGSTRALLEVLTLGPALGRLSGRRVGVLGVREGPAHFASLAAMCVDGEVRVHIDRIFPLEEVPQALAHVGEGRALGKVVVVAEPPS